MTFYDIFTYLCTFTIIIPLAVFCLFPVIDHLKTPIRHLLIKISLVFICYFVLLIIPYMIFQQDLGNILIFLAVPVFFYLFQKETNLMLPASLFVMLTACCLGSLSYVIYHAFGVIFHPHGQSTEFYPESMIAQLIFLVFADIILYKPARKYLGWMVTNFHNAFVWRIACIFPCCFTFLVFTYIPHNYYDIYTYHDLHVYFSMMLTLLVFVFLLYVLFYTIIHNYVENQYILEEQKILEIQAKEYSQLSQHVQETREIRHDFRHQITVISGLLNQGNYEELKEYLSQYESSISLQTKIYCRQPAVNAILSHYDLLCAQDKIKTKFAVDFPTLSSISSVDFCIVLGNLLENAYLECKTLQKYEKFIHLKARQTSPGAFVLLIENPYEHEIKKTDSGFFLSSRRKNCVGTGLKSVTAICKKYDGHLSIETDNHRFKVKMFLQC